MREVPPPPRGVRSSRAGRSANPPWPALPGRSARRSQRALALLIDAALSVLCFWLAARWTPIQPFSLPRPSIGLGWTLLGNGLALTLFAAVQGWTLQRSGQTLGQAALRLRVLRRDGSAASPARLWLRMGLVWGLTLLAVVGPALAALDALLALRRSGRCGHDDLTDTWVVRY